MAASSLILETQFTTRLPGRFLFKKPSQHPPQQLVLGLHGYQERAERMFRLIEPSIPENAALLIPNGPFPVPIKKTDEFKEAYSWYFYQTKTQQFLIDPTPALNFLEHLLIELELRNLPLRIVGFSQGGFFAPLVGGNFGTTQQVVGISCSFPSRYLPKVANFRIDAIHGSDDLVVPCSQAQNDFNVLQDLGWQGHFTEIKGLDHRINAEVQEKLSQILSSN